ncbi:hypothetical protein SERLA73DRAFT_186278 [Serpula lacrymans var. lacrymans S7.3]|uniref:PPP4R2-domain-containing protein n=2 Tax=Serpula lacrymans var. lacrymans TaxID=341189 RepID=F8Q724_SERL3|nr:uncharacterized protein SERLADRAFT_475238 [Serpula lacrymans var. lacrymans S7.9]EGN95362.1 hypothetical protein SERLA73DRAFT_186278 [Serpula lacrymans var. lacrymans S7.3]EGO20896.1 hypothetical protein SERLADRAFT_475238 [Serpula lacrymans var. lacrymans S7.9]
MSDVDGAYHISPNFEWKADYDAVLDGIATTDVVHTEWTTLRDIIKYKINQNTGLFPSNADQLMAPIVPSQNYADIDSGNLKLPPFPPRRRNELNPVEVPKVHLNQQETNEMKSYIFKQLHEFDETPPFTIQRLCELCLQPKQHYRALGKYLRAVEKTLLVTSSWNSFPIESNNNGPNTTSISLSGTIRTVPTTPLFSPIPFLHDDARRSKSRSPPPSPLALNAMEAGGPVESLTEGMPQRALGLVDELDDPNPGHMSDHPTALTAVTTVTPQPFLGSLEQRFVKAEGGPGTQEGESRTDMAVDGADDKENK